MNATLGISLQKDLLMFVNTYYTFLEQLSVTA